MSPLLTSDELDTLLAQLVEQGATSDAEALRVVRWAETIRVQATVLDMVLAGKATIRIDADDAAHIRLTIKGECSIRE